MGYGLPIVMTDVGGNAEAAQGYEGVRMVAVGDPDAILAAIREVRGICGRRFRHPHSWANTADAYERFFAMIRRDGATPVGAGSQAEGEP